MLLIKFRSTKLIITCRIKKTGLIVFCGPSFLKKYNHIIMHNYFHWYSNYERQKRREKDNGDSEGGKNKRRIIQKREKPIFFKKKKGLLTKS